MFNYFKTIPAQEYMNSQASFGVCEVVEVFAINAAKVAIIEDRCLG